MDKLETLAKWIETRKNRGFYTFSVEDVISDFPQYEYSYVFISLGRQIKRKTIISPVRGFYVIIPTEYALTGNVPPIFYIDKMMRYLDRDYYVALLNAAEFYGAAHQRPQTFSVINTLPTLRNGIRSNTRFEFIATRLPICQNLITKRDSKLGTINVSCAELTALDLVANEKKVGGLNRVCTVINDLTESFKLENFGETLMKIYPTSIYQRLGYILECVLENKEWADVLFALMKVSKCRFRPVPFKIDKTTDGFECTNRWKVIENQEIEIDE